MKRPLTAYRPEVARAKRLPEPANYLTHTSVRNPDEVFKYSFRDVNGKVVSNDDPRFKGKVVLAIVTGSWVPQLPRRSAVSGKSLPAISCQGASRSSRSILRNPIRRNRSLASMRLIKAVQNTLHLPDRRGTPDEMWDKVPQAVNLNTWPATLFIGRDGKVKATYSGFASAASGVYNKELKEDFTSIIDRLLAGGSVQSTASIQQAGAGRS